MALNECKSECRVEYTLELASKDIVPVFLHSATRTRLPSCAIPILAGRYQDGTEAFMAGGWFQPATCTPLSNRIEPRHDATAWFWVLRYAPETYSRRYGPDDFIARREGGIDATGPYSWKFNRYVSHIEEVEEDGINGSSGLTDDDGLLAKAQ